MPRPSRSKSVSLLLILLAGLFVRPAAAIEPNCTDGFDGDDDKLADCDDPDCAFDPACLERGQCLNGADDDSDGLTDCADLGDCCSEAACALAPGCPEHACANGVDDDGDGEVDCADGDCAGDPACDESTHCANGVDDDRDGRTDCADRECCDDPACDAAPGCPERRCADGADNDSDGRVDCEDADCALACSETSHCDDLLDNDEDGRVDCEDGDCALARECLERLHCSDGLDNDLDTRVDCDDADCCEECPPSPLCPETDCDNGIDDDLDGLTDCADGDCLTTSDCSERLNCHDERDNDGDGLVDCDDSDCRCGTERGRCTNGRDDDHDGEVDCDDADCCRDAACAGTAGSCQELRCSDGIDDEGDGWVDCDDYDCRGAANCPCEFPFIDGCDRNHGVLLPPTEDCRYRAGRACIAASPYEIVLEPGIDYVFTFCDATCPSAGADFDGLIVLDGPRTTVVSTPTCDGKGELRFRPDPADGVATYCLRIGSSDPLSGGSGFTLGYKAECSEPGPLSLTPLSARLAPGACSARQAFTGMASRARLLDWEWTITPPAGGTAIPSAGSARTPDGALRFESDLAGDGDFTVELVARSACGESRRTIAFRLADRHAPDVAAWVTPADCAAPPPLALPPPPPVPAPPPPCLAPCTTPVLSVAHPFFDLSVRCGDGAFAIRTGAAHPVTLSEGAPQNVTYGGAAESPGTSQLAWRLHDLGLTLINPFGAVACVIDPPDTPQERGSTGILTEWVVTPLPGLVLRLRHELVAYGLAEDEAGVRSTLEIVNESASETVQPGLRWLLDSQLGPDDGPRRATTRCEPRGAGIESAAEHRFLPDELQDFLRLSNDRGPAMTVSLVTGDFGLPDSFVPDRVLYGAWPRLKHAPWTIDAIEGSTAPDDDSGVLVHAGWAPSLSPVLAPGASLRRSLHLVASEEAFECGVTIAGSSIDGTLRACEGDCVVVDVGVTDACGATLRLVAATPAAPPCTPPCVISPPPGVHRYEWEAVDAAGQATRATATIEMARSGDPGCNQPPSCGPLAAPPASCGRVSLAGSATDPDGDVLAATWTTDCPGATFEAGAGEWSPVLVLASECAAACSVSVTATDPAGATCTATAPVSASDDPPRLVGVPSDATAACDAVPPPAPVVVVDACDPAPGLAFTEVRIDGPCPGRYELRREWTGSDRCGHLVSAAQSVRVEDAAPPVIAPDESLRGCLWPPQHRRTCFGRDAFAPSITDACSEPVTWRLWGCESDQPDDGIGDGSTRDDCVVSPDGEAACVRGERQGGGAEGRRYRVLAVATDACGNVSAPQVVGVIAVPHDADDAAALGCARGRRTR